MSDFNHTRENLKRVMNLPDDYPNKEDIVKHWQRELKQERLGIILERQAMREYKQK